MLGTIFFIFFFFFFLSVVRYRGRRTHGPSLLLAPYFFSFSFYLAQKQHGLILGMGKEWDRE